MSAPSPGVTVRPYRIAVAENVLLRIAQRVHEYRWDVLPDASPWGDAPNRQYMRDITGYWLDGYDWRKQEAALNRFPQFTAEIDGITVHFFHVKGSGPRPQALILSHGWPGSAFEFCDLIEPLAHPQCHGGDAGDSVDVVVPCLPGFGFSGKPRQPIGPRAIAALFNKLMTEVLGYSQYVAQGGDWGSAVSSWLGFDHGAACKAIHLNMVLTQSALGPESADERAWAAHMQQMSRQEGAYSQVQATKAQALAIAMMDSPVGMAAWILEKFAAWSDLPRSAQGGPDLGAKYSFDQLLTNIMFYVATDSFATASWIYHALLYSEDTRHFPPGRRCETPTAVAAFPDPFLCPPPRSLAEKAYNIVRWTPMPRGGHFAAMEEPQLLLADMRAFFRSCRAA